jgi:hypothetical protein
MLKPPSFADVTIRTQALPVVLCTKVQTAKLLVYGEQCRTATHSHLTDFDIAAIALKKHGWARVEKHGNRILLIAVVTDDAITDEERRLFTRHGEMTGNWSWIDFRHDNPKRLLRTRRSY